MKIHYRLKFCQIPVKSLSIYQSVQVLLLNQATKMQNGREHSHGFVTVGGVRRSTEWIKLLTCQTQNTIIGELVNGCIQFSFRGGNRFWSVVSNRGAPLWGKWISVIWKSFLRSFCHAGTLYNNVSSSCYLKHRCSVHGLQILGYTMKKLTAANC